MDESCGRCMFYSLGNCQTVFQSDCTVLYSYQTCRHASEIRVQLQSTEIKWIYQYKSHKCGGLPLHVSYVYTIVSCVQQHYVFKKQWWISPKLCLTLATPRTVARQAPLSMEFSRQEYWSGLPFLSPGALPDPDRLFTDWATWEVSFKKYTP